MRHHSEEFWDNEFRFSNAFWIICKKEASTKSILMEMHAPNQDKPDINTTRFSLFQKLFVDKYQYLVVEAWPDLEFRLQVVGLSEQSIHNFDGPFLFGFEKSFLSNWLS